MSRSFHRLMARGGFHARRTRSVLGEALDKAPVEYRGELEIALGALERIELWSGQIADRERRAADNSTIMRV